MKLSKTGILDRYLNYLFIIFSYELVDCLNLVINDKFDSFEQDLKCLNN